MKQNQSEPSYDEQLCRLASNGNPFGYSRASLGLDETEYDYEENECLDGEEGRQYSRRFPINIHD